MMPLPGSAHIHFQCWWSWFCRLQLFVWRNCEAVSRTILLLLPGGGGHAGVFSYSAMRLSVARQSFAKGLNALIAGSLPCKPTKAFTIDEVFPRSWIWQFARRKIFSGCPIWLKNEPPGRFAWRFLPARPLRWCGVCFSSMAVSDQEKTLESIYRLTFADAKSQNYHN